MTVKNHSKTCLIISACIMALAVILSLCGLGINYGIDFTGGLSLQYDMGGDFDQADINAALNEMNVGSYTVTEQGTSEVIVRVKEVSEEGVQGLQAAFEAALAEKYPNMTQSGDVSYVGPVAGQTLLYNAFMSVLIASALMLAYIAIRFDLNSGIAAVLGLVHDVLMMLSFMVLLRSVVQMNSSFIAAMLTIVGYSINNTIVIFDRIRENAKKLSRYAPGGCGQPLCAGVPGPYHQYDPDHPDYHCAAVHPGCGQHPGVRAAHHRGPALRRVQRQHDQRLCLGFPGRKAQGPQGCAQDQDGLSAHIPFWRNRSGCGSAFLNR